MVLKTSFISKIFSFSGNFDEYNFMLINLIPISLHIFFSIKNAPWLDSPLKFIID